MFVRPAATITISPSFGFSAVTKKLWKTFWSINGIRDIKLIRPYSTQLSRSSPVAPKAMLMGRTKMAPRTAKNKPPIIVV